MLQPFPFLRILTVPRLVKKFPALYATQKFITMFITAHHSHLSWARCIQSMPSQHIYLRSISELCFHPSLSFRFPKQNSVYFLSETLFQFILTLLSYGQIQEFYFTVLSVSMIIQHQWKTNEYGTLEEWYWEGKTKVLGEKKTYHNSLHVPNRINVHRSLEHNFMNSPMKFCCLLLYHPVYKNKHKTIEKIIFEAKQLYNTLANF